MRNFIRFNTSIKSLGLFLMVISLGACSKSEDKASAPVQGTESAQSTAPSSQSSDLIKNKDFSDWSGSQLNEWTPEPWAVVKLAHGSETHNNKPAAEVTLSGGHIGIVYQPVQTEALHAGDLLEGSVWVKASEPDITLMIMSISEQDGKEERSYLKGDRHPGDGQWHQLKVKWPYVPGSKQNRFMIWADEKVTKPFFISEANLIKAPGK